MLTDLNQFLTDNPQFKRNPSLFVRTFKEKTNELKLELSDINDLYPHAADSFFVKCLINGITTVQDVPLCPVCNTNKVRYDKHKIWFAKTCSTPCGRKMASLNAKKTIEEKYGTHFNATDEVQEKRKKTTLERYGVDHPTKTEEHRKAMKERMSSSMMREKIKETFKRKYGVDNVGELYYETNESRKKTNIERYGVPNPLSNPEVVEKRRLTFRRKYGADTFLGSAAGKDAKKDGMIQKYGEDNIFKTEEFKEKVRDKNRQQYGYAHHLQNEMMADTIMNKEWVDQFIANEGYNIFKMAEDSQCHFSTACDWLERHGIRDKTKKNPTYLEEFVANLLIEHNVSFIRNFRMQDGKQIDILIEDQNFGVELHGNYWHSSLFKESSYHLNKLKSAESEGITLLQIFEDEIVRKPDIVKKMILMKLGMNPDERVSARKTTIQNVPSKDFIRFLDDNHIQGSVGCKVKVGLYSDGVLVACMGFSTGKRNLNDGEWELVRFATSKHVVGGFSKLLTHFRREYAPQAIVSFSDRRISCGGVYMANGFKFVHNTPPNYFYMKNGDWLNRQRKENFTKSRMKQTLEHYNESLSESQNAFNHDYAQIHDCGLTKWRMTFES